MLTCYGVPDLIRTAPQRRKKIKTMQKCNQNYSQHSIRTWSILDSAIMFIGFAPKVFHFKFTLEVFKKEKFVDNFCFVFESVNKFSSDNFIEWCEN